MLRDHSGGVRDLELEGEVHVHHVQACNLHETTQGVLDKRILRFGNCAAKPDPRLEEGLGKELWVDVITRT